MLLEKIAKVAGGGSWQKKNKMKKVIVAIFVAAIMGVGLFDAQADVITLSGFSSDGTSPGDLDAIIEFSVAETILSIEVWNLTDGPDSGEDTGYDIMSIYFNATENVSGLTLTDPTSVWILYPLSNHTKAGGFGQFDFALIDGMGNDPHQIDGEAFEIFTLTVEGMGVSASDFHSDLSVCPPGNSPMLVAAKFVNGPGDDSAFGAVPEPATVSLLGLGSLSLLRRRRK